MRICIFLDPCTTHFLDLLECGKVNAVRIIDIAVRIGARHNLRTKFLRLLNGVCSDISSTGDNDCFACEVDSFCRKHILHEVEKTIARRFSTRKTSPVVRTFACQNTRIVGVTNALVLSKKITDLTPADANIACRYIHIWTDMTIELRHEALAELHHFVI